VEDSKNFFSKVLENNHKKCLIEAFFYLVGSMSFFLSITSYSFSQVGFGGVYFGFLSRDFWAGAAFFS
jgi:hypothetical protein